jgi:peptidoglycan/xylan/chitin deacetylase (PgdA/CDA1 family)
VKLQTEDDARYKRWLPDGTHPIAEGSLAITWPAIEAMMEKARIAASPSTRASVPSTQISAPQIHVARFAGDRAAAISYTFDDNLRDQYTLALPMLNDVGFKGTFFVIAGKTAETPEEGAARQRDPNVRGKWGGISWPELKEMSQQGHEIASHTWSHAGLTRLSPEELDTELSKAYESIKAHIGKPPLTLAFPGNGSNAAVQAAALKYHVAFRAFQEATTDKSTVASLNAWADQLVREKKWGVLMTHAILDGYAAMSKPEIFRDHLKYVKGLGNDVWVDTFANVARYNLERDDAKVIVLSAGRNSVSFTVVGQLDPTRYDVPLTLVIEAPGATTGTAERAGRDLPARIAGGTIQVDANPTPHAVTVTWR